jgi:hypothetical protein
MRLMQLRLASPQRIRGVRPVRRTSARFPSTCTDTFGPKFATAFLIPIANIVKSSTGSWRMVFVVTALMNFIVVGLALFSAEADARAHAQKRLALPPTSTMELACAA